LLNDSDIKVEGEIGSQDSQLINLDPRNIRQNPENPRIHFPQDEMEKLMQSIDTYGVLVPISVYYEPGDGTEYVIVDGERRWRAALRLNLKTIPALLIQKPNRAENLLTMFNTHMVREPWKDMPTAWALQKIIEETGINDPTKLAELTGLSRDRVQHLLIALKLPRDYQEKIDKGEIPLNFFVELDNRVVKSLDRNFPDLLDEYGEIGIIEKFVEKREAGNLPDVVDLRKVAQIIKVAAQQAASGEGERFDFKNEIRTLIEDKSRTIEETYENTVETIVEAETFVRQCGRLVRKLEWLLSKELAEEDQQKVLNAVLELINNLQSLIRDFVSN